MYSELQIIIRLKDYQNVLVSHTIISNKGSTHTESQVDLSISSIRSCLDVFSQYRTICFIGGELNVLRPLDLSDLLIGSMCVMDH